MAFYWKVQLNCSSDNNKYLHPVWLSPCPKIDLEKTAHKIERKEKIGSAKSKPHFNLIFYFLTGYFYLIKCSIPVALPMKSVRHVGQMDGDRLSLQCEIREPFLNWIEHWYLLAPAAHIVSILALGNLNWRNHGFKADLNTLLCIEIQFAEQKLIFALILDWKILLIENNP